MLYILFPLIPIQYHVNPSVHLMVSSLYRPFKCLPVSCLIQITFKCRGKLEEIIYVIQLNRAMTFHSFYRVKSRAVRADFLSYLMLLLLLLWLFINEKPPQPCAIKTYELWLPKNVLQSLGNLGRPEVHTQKEKKKPVLRSRIWGLSLGFQCWEGRKVHHHGNSCSRCKVIQIRSR